MIMFGSCGSNIRTHTHTQNRSRSSFFLIKRRSIKKPSIKIRNLWISDCRIYHRKKNKEKNSSWGEKRGGKFFFLSFCDLSFDISSECGRKKWMNEWRNHMSRSVSNRLFYSTYDLFILTQISIKDIFYMSSIVYML